ncbi:MAG TPA: DUF99 family protein [Candidatus Woesearchaeota archaeon]|nr:DUF99 family protein [Candidatus Woesearchaeota archaeon]
MKELARAIGIDDAPFDKWNDRKAILIGTILQGNAQVDGFLKSEVDIDGDDATDILCKMITSSRFFSQLRVIFLDGVSVAGFNVLSPDEINDRTKIPVIAIMRKKPVPEEMAKALKRLGMDKKTGLLKTLPEPVKHNKVFFQAFGITQHEARQAIDLFTLSSEIPEPLRISHMIGQMLKFNESKGQA